MEPLIQNTAKNILIWMADSTDHVTGKTGLTLTITLSKNAGGFSVITPTVTVTERSYGWYQLALTASHIDTVGNFSLHITSTGADPTDYINDVIVWNPKHNIKAFDTLLKSTAKEFVFWVPDALNPTDGKTGLVDADFSPISISKNGGSFTNIASSVTVTEIDYGFYKFTLSATHTDTVGDLAIFITVDNNGMVELPFICYVVAPSGGGGSPFFFIARRGAYVGSSMSPRIGRRVYG
jgi:hypothetical protein